MDSSSPPPPTASGTSIVNSPSDLSYSSGASHTSTRNTSPNSITANSSSRRSSPLLDLNLHIDDIEHSPNTLLDPQPKMDRNPFQSVNERRNKLTTDRSHTNQAQSSQQQQQQQQQQNYQIQTMRPSMQQPNLPTRGLASSNWRSQATMDEQAAIPARAADYDYTPFDPAIGPYAQHNPGLRQSSYTNPRMDQFPPQQASAIASYPNPGIYTEMQLESYAYCYDRGNGQYTRLIPADMLPPLKDVPALQQSCSGMTVVPQPQALPPNGRSSNTEPVILRSPATASSPSDTIQLSAPQSRIDTIVASTPQMAEQYAMMVPRPGLTGLGLGSAAAGGTVGGSGGGGGGGGNSHHTQTPHHHPGGHAHNHPHTHNHGHGHGAQGAQQQQPQRRPKIYCDKWVHEGVCAFTQQGCKYKHEMPFDKVTQHQLGLFHGFPAWWKKHQADLSRQREGPVGSAGGPGDEGSGGAGMEEPARLSGGDRFSARGGGGGGGGGETGGMSPAGQSLPAWRRGGDPQQQMPQQSEQKSLASMRGVARGGMGPGVGAGAGAARTPGAPHGSPFGPIGPPSRLHTGLVTKMEDLSISIPGPSGQIQPQHLGNVGGMGGVSSVGGTPTMGGGVPTTNPYSSLESLDDRDAGNGDGEEESLPSLPHSSGVRLK
ncbi:hypothetical protein GGR54DRAFT_654009 [Hypoxylon sp. NC1633]|nr:hypothetical protein GGR54DRAFT_654009 [Hypoxylon sp. NC1633]